MSPGVPRLLPPPSPQQSTGEAPNSRLPAQLHLLHLAFPEVSSHLVTMVTSLVQWCRSCMHPLPGRCVWCWRCREGAWHSPGSLTTGRYPGHPSNWPLPCSTTWATGQCFSGANAGLTPPLPSPSPSYSQLHPAPPVKAAPKARPHVRPLSGCCEQWPATEGSL